MAKLSEYKGNNACFINPYNFVKVNFEKKPERTKAQSTPGKHTGILHCKLVTKTPLLIPDMSKVPNKPGHKELTFLRTESGVPMIPGSSLRGPVRSMFETLTNSCLSTVDERKSITYRTKNAFSPALLFIDNNNGYHLYAAKRYIFEVRGDSYAPYRDEYGKPKEPNLFLVEEEHLKDYSYGQKVYIQPLEEGGKEKTFTTSGGYLTQSVFISKMLHEQFDQSKEGFICIGEPFGKKKHFESVFVRDKEIDLSENQEGCDSLNKAVKALKTIIDCYNDDKLNANAKGRKTFYSDRNYKSFEIGKYYPVWYEEPSQNEPIKHIHLSVANIGRAAYNKSMGDMIDNHKACKDRSEACPACRLFGMAKGEGIGTRVRFTDAVSNQPMPSKEPVVLKDLLGPKISYLPFYLRKKDGGAFGKKISYDDDAYTIRGRKFYWHNTEADAWRDPLNKPTDMNASAELVDKGTSFCFDVYYDSLTEDELKALEWTLTLGENYADGKQCYKIGHGKPIGLGSVKISIVSGEERNFDGNDYKINEIEVLKEKNGENLFDKEIVDQIKIITDIDEPKIQVDYPGIVDGKGTKYTDGSKNSNHAPHQWFSSNFTLGKKNKPDQIKILPEISEINNEESALRWRTDCNNGRNNSGNQERPGKQTDGVRNNEKTIKNTSDIITVKVKKVNKDKNDPSMQVAFGNNVKVLKVPGTIKQGDIIEVELFRRYEDGKSLGNFLSKKE